MIDLDEYKRQADAGELHPRQIDALIAELREARRERDYARGLADVANAKAEAFRVRLAEMTRERDEALSGEHEAVQRAESAELGCEIAYRREPTQAEGDAHESRRSADAITECHVPMGNHHGHRCRCGRWVWGGPTVCQRCVDADSIKIALEWKAEADRLRKIFDDAGQGERNVLALIDHYQDDAVEEMRKRYEAEHALAESRAGRGVPVEVREALLGLVEDARESGLTTWPTIVEAWLDAEPQSPGCATCDNGTCEGAESCPDCNGTGSALDAFIATRRSRARATDTVMGEPQPPAPDRYVDGFEAAKAAAIEYLLGEDCVEGFVDGDWTIDVIRALQPGKGER